MARNRHGPMSDLSPLYAQKRKLDFGAVRSVSDPKPTLSTNLELALSPHHRFLSGSGSLIDPIGDSAPYKLDRLVLSALRLEGVAPQQIDGVFGA